MANKKFFKSKMPSEEEEILIANMNKQIQSMRTQLQRMKEEDDTSSKKFSLRDYLPSYNVESKPSQKNLQTLKKSRNIFEEKPWEPKPKRDFTPLGSEGGDLGYRLLPAMWHYFLSSKNLGLMYLVYIEDTL